LPPKRPSLSLARRHRTHSTGARDTGPGAGQVYRLFRRELESTYTTHPTVTRFAHRLGFSESTLNRACRMTAGHCAKVLIDRRMSLEAARMIGTTPARFREQHIPPGSR
jgi:AraC-like DNA-binding protein